MIYLLVDTSNILFRTFYALPTSIKNSNGITINAIQGTFITIAKAIKLINANKVECVLEGKSFRRRKINPSYKANRIKKPKELEEQIKLIPDIFSHSGFALIDPANEEEADDALASRAIELYEQGHTIYILTNDKDLEAILNKKINILKPTSNGIEIWDDKVLFEKRNILPEQVTNYLALIGDKSDNITGVPGIGPAKAKKLISNNNIEQKIKDTEKIKLFKESKKLIKLNLKCPYTYINIKGNDPINTLKNYGCLKASEKYYNILNTPKQNELF